MKIHSIQLTKIGDNIRKMRLNQHLKQEFLAQKIGLSKSEISRIESGNRCAKITKLVEIAKILNVNISDLFEGVN